MTNPFDRFDAPKGNAFDRFDSVEPAKAAKATFGQMLKDEAMTSLPGGVVRGLKDVIDTGARGASWLSDQFTGGSRGAQVKEMNDAGDADFKAAQERAGAGLSDVGRVGGQVLATAPVGPVLAAGARFAGAPTAAVNALRTAGFSTGSAPVGFAAKAGDLALRSGAGAVVGGASAGIVNPEDADMGAVIGAVMPGALQVIGKVGQSMGNRAAANLAERTKEFGRNSPMNDTIKASIDAGYIIPPNMAKPSFTNQVIESISGKQATQQLASAKNSEVTDALVRKALGLADDAPLSQSTMERLRKTAGKAYAEVADISSQAADDLEALKVARNDSQGWFKAYNRSARPDDLAKAKEFRTAATDLEAALEKHAADAGRKELIPALRDARKQIAKTYTVGRALNDAAGTVDARVLGRMSEKGLPLSDGLDVAGKFASAFPTVAKTAQQVGSPAAHNLKSMASMAMGGGGYAALGPFGAVAATVPFIAPPMARSLMFRGGAQSGLINAAPQMSRAAQMAGLLADPAIQLGLLRSAPVMGAQ